jgi:hypothetical protein
LRMGMVGSLTGEVLGSTLDFLSKEFVRQNELQRLQRMLILAENTRRMREAEESGRRQREEHARMVINEQYNQLMMNHYSTVATYLDEIIEEAITTAAHHHALQKHEDTVANKARSSEDALDATEWDIRDLVANFLLPVVEREAELLQNQINDVRLSKAVRDCLYDGNILAQVYYSFEPR